MASVHGGLNYKDLREKGINPDDVLDFSVSINPDPLPDSMIHAVRDSRICRYPDSDSLFLREKIAAFNTVDPDNILVVNGTSQGISLIVSALLNQDDTVCIVKPTYSGYEEACRLKTDNIVEIAMGPGQSFHEAVPLISSTLLKEKPALLWLCSPNNPTGSYLEEDDFDTLCRICRESETVLILDEAYVCFVSDEKRYRALKKDVIVLRSMTKDFGIPGLRLGYLMGQPEILSRIRKWQPEWSLSAPAQDAGIAAFSAIEYFRTSWQKTIARREVLRKELKELGLNVYDSCSNFFLVEVPDTAGLKTHLWKDLILVRDCSSFNLNNFIRIGVRTDADNRKLTASIKEYLKK
ncbi:MAG: histidinol-phosphate transaminase [Spirochaetales bacterium]|nr:histidinol-phosphate transaminase [Spirochaetales bacterium]